MIEDAFEKKFGIPVLPNEAAEGEQAKLINKRGIYKDCYKASNAYTDFQLRPNFPIAMVVVCLVFCRPFVGPAYIKVTLLESFPSGFARDPTLCQVVFYMYTQVVVKYVWVIVNISRV